MIVIVLSLIRCRSILGPEAESLADDQLELVREQLYSFAGLLISDPAGFASPHTFTEAHEGEKSKGFNRALNVLHEDNRQMITERAGILEYDAGISRDEAERQAVLLSLDKLN